MAEPPTRKRAKYLTKASPVPTPEPRVHTHGFSFCESVHATSHSPWHIRPLTEAGKKLGGGVDTESLCLIVSRGWDLEVDITEHHLKHACKRCVAEYLKLKLKS